jgi:parvulin-like peptidyl-prolyl isomerase
MPLAQSIKDQLDSGANVTALADQYTQYTDVGKGGELGIMSSSTNVSSAFNGYVYDPNVKLGVWSDPIRDTSISTKGGYWVVQVVDRRDNSPLSDADRNTLMSKAYNDWSQGLATDPKYKVNVTFPQSLQNWAVNRATNELQSSG